MKLQLNLSLLLMLFFLLFASGAQARERTWTFEGQITQDLSSLQGFDVDDPYTFSVTFDSVAPGVNSGSFTQYAGTATFTSAESASDLTAIIRIADAPNSISINIEPPDTTLFQLELTNSPGMFREPSRISIVLLFGGGGSEDIQDYLELELPGDPSTASRRLEIVFQGFGGIIGSVDSVESSSPVPSGGAPWLLLPALGIGGAVFVGVRRGERIGDVSSNGSNPFA